MQIRKVHHIALICSDYSKSKDFYTRVLGFEVIREVYRADRNSYKLDLALNGAYGLELFSFPNPPMRPTQPEACGLRHLAFEVDNLEKAVDQLLSEGVSCEPIRLDIYTQKKFVFFFDPDHLPLELYEK